MYGSEVQSIVWFCLVCLLNVDLLLVPAYLRFKSHALIIFQRHF